MKACAKKHKIRGNKRREKGFHKRSVLSAGGSRAGRNGNRQQHTACSPDSRRDRQQCTGSRRTGDHSPGEICGIIAPYVEAVATWGTGEEGWEAVILEDAASIYPRRVLVFILILMG